ncbi:MAG: serine/threonine-protein phosphatase [Oscillatoriales cyanobacterium]|nr:MAG: serine/threonine-protein phosphatase [Oscillatoriales cyanobacterium]TAD98594.1 MAG: serine/threonine-protein phosphatase [Oscillatoriales cyanobacterium]TAE01098.1 MAG: serine/threonine-protein phosphatase [Oscillatoriales cyanobacterium]TAF05949.1 MAG: serine/threonine-protein phosphatase [Oscillatoriales cyanobacterium]TAF47923.1 MAG: serine/threonine-protein phosphatase [Oscillatoriales cyanobacterium]
MFLQKLPDMMNTFSQSIYCPNLGCPEPRNTFGRQECVACSTPLIYRHLWAVGPDVEEVPQGKAIGDRYLAIAPQIWLDTRPDLLPSVPEELPDAIMPYLHLYPQRLHIPEVYGFFQLAEAAQTFDVLLLENVPITTFGRLYPSILEAWSKTSAVRQVYWLWQMLQLWAPLSEQGVASSLLVPENLRVEGWRVRLLELHQGNFVPTLRDLGDVWSGLVESAQPQVKSRLGEICGFMRRSSMNLEAIALELNDLLLEQAAQLPLHLDVFGMTDTGPQRSQNEDSCYPNAADFKLSKTSGNDKLLPYLTIVCDGVGGHEGGEVASQLAVQSLKSLIQNFMAEIAEQDELMTPTMVIKQLQEIVRVVNNVISAQNNEQGKELRERMGTTLVMALQLPQKIKVVSEDVRSNNAHELYLVNVGDSRAYWIAENSCQRLTVDDDVASREVRLGHSLYWESQRRSDAGALTQALGTRDGDFLQPTIQRFIVEDEGLLLLCSDGLSDNDWVEQSWESYGPAVLKGEMSLEVAVEYLINLGNEKNGYDNTSVVMTHCRMSPEKLILFQPTEESAPMSPSVSLPMSKPMSGSVSLKKSLSMPQTQPQSQLSESSKQLLYPETAPAEAPAQKQQGFQRLLPLLGLLAIVLVCGGLGLWVRSLQNSEPVPGQLPPPPESPSPTPSELPSPSPELPPPPQRTSP